MTAAGQGNVMRTYRQDFDRVLLFTGGGVAVFVWSLMVYHSTTRDLAHRWGYIALSNFFARPDLELYRRFCVLLILLVFRPDWLGRYHQVLVAVFVATSLLMVPVEGILHPGKATSTASTKTSTEPPINGLHGNHWAEIVNGFNADLNKEIGALNTDMQTAGFPDKVNTPDMVANPKDVARRLKAAHELIARHRAAFAKIAADARAGLEAEKNGQPSPLLQMYQDKAAQRGEALDQGMAVRDQMVTEFESLLRDVRKASDRIELRNKQVFTNAEDHEMLTRHYDRITRLSKQLVAARQPASPKP